jgi:hypothetical protein
MLVLTWVGSKPTEFCLYHQASEANDTNRYVDEDYGYVVFFTSVEQRFY